MDILSKLNRINIKCNVFEFKHIFLKKALNTVHQTERNISFKRLKNKKKNKKEIRRQEFNL